MPRTALKLPAIFICGLAILYSCITMPLYQLVLTNAVLSTTILVDLLDFFSWCLETLVIATAFGFLIHAIYRYGLKGAQGLCCLIGGALLFKYVSGVFTVGWAGGSFYFPDDLWTLLISFFIEITVLVLVAFLAHKYTSARKQDNLTLEKASRQLGVEYTPKETFFPLRPILRLSNPLLCAAFWGTIAVFFFRALSFVIFFLASAPFFTWADVPSFIIYLLILVVIPSVAGYFLTLGCIQLAEKKTK